MSRQVLSGREHFHDLVHTPREHSNRQTESSHERSPIVEAPRTSEELNKIQLQAEILLESKKSQESRVLRNGPTNRQELKHSSVQLQYAPKS